MQAAAAAQASSRWMDRALDLAEQALYRTSPNPRVGCVLVDARGQVIGEGATQRAGGPHAEIMALRDAQARGHAALGATAYVTLEPCAHTGRTGPCCVALAQAGVAKVYAALLDPNPRVAGQGVAYLRSQGVEVEVGLGAERARELNLGFLSRMVRGQPWVRMKAATSLDGKTALPNGVSQWITGEAARNDGQQWRARACAILTGVGTVLADNPRLDVRSMVTERQPRLVIADSQLRTPPDGALFAAERQVLIYTARADAPQAAALQQRGAVLVEMPDAQGRVDIPAMLSDLARREVNELHVEAGAVFNGALLASGMLDELLLYLAPSLLGMGADMAQWGPLTDLAQRVPLGFQDVRQVGADLRVLARVPGRDRF
ncbi:MAG: bifunctional diaminohydroxyphosphoribosylaminopyrimidine deaminase/5-amino-6-(5-phosphoribosylamino)uracil reductase RibD [Acidovorax sp.]|jgi:diaminohydroxyphosphoribosylaminopyrimidine deaminase/5-amino-6-(5-phosphoribosylamino)uracil reductase|nr:bifunctional diaminohydroxyphosphoribosylaminopyrimidine deaminase/5-amino-6-(5-phosphoribosylamino)uracil reductase RibD [Acidovorax sp.]